MSLGGYRDNNSSWENERMAAVLACMGDGVISTDLNGIIDFMNSAAEALTGWVKGEACFGNGIVKLVTALTEQVGVVNKHYTVVYHYTHEHNQTHKCCDT